MSSFYRHFVNDPAAYLLIMMIDVADRLSDEVVGRIELHIATRLSGAMLGAVVGALIKVRSRDFATLSLVERFHCTARKTYLTER
jgi:hypothetical protein